MADLEQVILSAYEQERKAAGEDPAFPQIERWADTQARKLETRGEPGDEKKARRLRDWMVKRQAGRLVETTQEAGRTLQAAAETPIRQRTAFGVMGDPVTSLERSELAQAAEEQAVRAPRDIGAARTITDQGDVQVETRVSPAVQMELLDAAGVKVEGKTENEIRHLYAQEFGSQIGDDSQGEKAAAYLWQRRAQNTLAAEAQGDEARGLDVQQLDFSTPELAKAFVKDVEAQRQARAAERAGGSVGDAALTTVRQEILGPLMNAGASIGSLARKNPLSGEDVATYLTGGGQDAVLDQEARAFAHEALDENGVLQATRLGLNVAGDLPLLYATGGTVRLALTAARLPAAVVSVAQGPLTFGLLGGAKSAGMGEGFWKGAAHGALMGVVAEGFGGAIRQAIGDGSRVTNAAVEAGALAVGEAAAVAALEDRLPTAEEVGQIALLGMGFGAHRKPGPTRAEAARTVMGATARDADAAIVVGPGGKAAIHPDRLNRPAEPPPPGEPPPPAPPPEPLPPAQPRSMQVPYPEPPATPRAERRPQGEEALLQGVRRLFAEGQLDTRQADVVDLIARRFNITPGKAEQVIRDVAPEFQATGNAAQVSRESLQADYYGEPTEKVRTKNPLRAYKHLLGRLRKATAEQVPGILGSLRDVWGKLGSKDREAIQNGQRERIPPLPHEWVEGAPVPEGVAGWLQNAARTGVAREVPRDTTRREPPPPAAEAPRSPVEPPQPGGAQGATPGARTQPRGQGAQETTTEPTGPKAGDRVKGDGRDGIVVGEYQDPEFGRTLIVQKGGERFGIRADRAEIVETTGSTVERIQQEIRTEEGVEPGQPADRRPAQTTANGNRRVLRTPPEQRTRGEQSARDAAADAKRGERRAQRAAMTDPLTGLPNRAAVDASRKRVEEDPNNGYVMGDLVGFKGPNDRRGQDFGDELLKEAARVWAETAVEHGLTKRGSAVVRPKDPAKARLGGDEFLSWNGTAEQRAAFARAIEGKEVTLDGETVTFRTGQGGTLKEASDAMVGAKERIPSGRGKPGKRRVLRGGGKAAPAPEPKRMKLDDEPAPELQSAPARPALAADRKEEGNTTTIADRKGEIEARYVLVKRDDVLPSHGAGFAWNEGYPRALQERDYSTDRGEQGKVREGASNLRPAQIANTSPLASEGMPTIARDGTVINGNGREQMRRSMDAKTRAAYNRYLIENAGSFGLSREVMTKRLAEGWDLYRQVDLDPRTKGATRFARTGQESGARDVKPVAKAARHMTLATKALFDTLRLGEGRTVSELVSDPSGGREFRKALRDALPDSERPRYLDSEGNLTAAGKELAEDLVLLRGFAEPGNSKQTAHATRILDSLPASVRRAIGGAAGELAGMRSSGPEGRRVTSALLEAADYWANVMGKADPREWLGARDRGELLVEPPPISETAGIWLDFLYRNRNAPRKFRDAIRNVEKGEEVTAREERGLFAGQTEQTTLEGRLREALGAADDAPSVRMPTNGEVLGMPATNNPSRQGEYPSGADSAPDPLMGDRAPAPQAMMPGNAARMREELPREPTSGFKGKAVSPSQLLQQLAKAAKIPLRLRFTQYGNRGEYHVGPRVMRIAQADDVFAAAHEFGHAIMPSAFTKAPAAALREADLLGRRLYKDGEPPNGYVSEGFAEWVRLRMLNPEAARGNKALSDWFDVWLKGQGKKFQREFSKSEELYGQYVAQGEANRLSTIVWDTKRDRPARNWRRVQRGIIRAMVESGIGLREAQQAAASERPLAWWEKPYDVLKSYRMAHTSTAAHWIERGAIDPFTNPMPGSPSLRAALRHIEPKHAKDFDLYLIARHAEDLHARGIATKMSPEEAARTIERLGSPAFQEAASILKSYADALLLYPVRAGVLSMKEAVKMREQNPNYVPFIAVRADLLDAAYTGGPSRLSGRLHKFVKGGSDPIRSPIEALAVETGRVIRRTHELMTIRALASLADVPGMGRFIFKIPENKVKADARVKAARQEVAQRDPQLDLFDNDVAVAFHGKRATLRDGKGLIPIRDPRTGKMEWYEVSKEVMQAVESMDGARLPRFFDWIFGKPKRALTLGVTGINVPFQIRNLIRDGSQSFIQASTDNPVAYSRDWARSFGQSVLGAMGRENPYYDLFVSLAGKASTPLVHDSRRTLKTVKGLYGKGKGQRIVRLLDQPVESVRDVLQFSEAVPRLAEARRVLERMGWRAGDQVTPEQSIAARIALKEANVDFTASGWLGRYVNQVVPFFNATVQGHRAVVRTMRDRPVSALVKALGSQTVPAMTLWAANKDEDWYKSMPWQEKFSYWWIDLGEETGELVGIPRAFDWGTWFGTMAEAIADSAYRQDPEAVGQALAFWQSTSVFSYLDPEEAFASSPTTRFIYERAKNRRLFRDSPIETPSQQKRPAKERYGPYTTGLAKKLGAALDWSPAKIDHFLETFFGNLPRDVLDFADLVPGVDLGTSGPGAKGFKSVPAVGQALGRRGGREGFRAVQVDKLYDEIAEARLRQGSIENPETTQERARRLGLEDAADAIGALRTLQRYLGHKEAQAVQREIRSLAEEALRDAGKRRFKAEFKKARSRAAAASQEGQGRRILRPGR